jgi:hypothetical protein
VVDNFLPGFGKVIFPSAMPFCLRFPPLVAGTGFQMCPMPDSVLPALCDHYVTAKTAFTPEASLSCSTFSFNDGELEFHLAFPFNGQCLEATAR